MSKGLKILCLAAVVACILLGVGVAAGTRPVLGNPYWYVAAAAICFGAAYGYYHLRPRR